MVHILFPIKTTFATEAWGLTKAPGLTPAHLLWILTQFSRLLDAIDCTRVRNWVRHNQAPHARELENRFERMVAPNVVGKWMFVFLCTLVSPVHVVLRHRHCNETWKRNEPPSFECCVSVPPYDMFSVCLPPFSPSQTNGVSNFSAENVCGFGDDDNNDSIVYVSPFAFYVRIESRTLHDNRVDNGASASVCVRMPYTGAHLCIVECVNLT